MPDNVATIYKEDYSPYGWHYLLWELGLISADPNSADHLNMNDKDSAAYAKTEIQVTLANK